MVFDYSATPRALSYTAIVHGERRVIVYVEDNTTNLDLVTRVLESTGRFRVIGAADGATGLEAIARERPALVLVDLDVPIVNGFEIARRIKASADEVLRDTPVVAISAHVLENEREASMNAGCAAFIAKPFDIHELRRAIDEVLAPAA